MTTPMIEKMARAMCRSALIAAWGQCSYQPDALDNEVDARWSVFTDYAQAALLALAEPDEGMVEAGLSHQTARGGCNCSLCQLRTAGTFKAMILNAAGREGE